MRATTSRSVVLVSGVVYRALPRGTSDYRDGLRTTRLETLKTVLDVSECSLVVLPAAIDFPAAVQRGFERVPRLASSVVSNRGSRDVHVHGHVRILHQRPRRVEIRGNASP